LAQAYFYPQSKDLDQSISGASRTVAKKLFKQYNIIGYICVEFVTFYDDLLHQKFLWATGLRFGLTPFHTSLGLFHQLLENVIKRRDDLISEVSLSFQLEKTVNFSSDSERRFCLFVPITSSPGLVGQRDDAFFKLANLNGIVFDRQTKQGIIFFLVDSIVSGNVTFLTVAMSRSRAVEYAITTLSFIQNHFTYTTGNEHIDSPNYIGNMLLGLKKMLHAEVPY